jgi:NADPH-dependent 2,4-dienoyl-CoA reductase/sulfur reductase-like enzyme
VVVGAGPYGLATAAHLIAAGVPVRAFGEPMESWDKHMPEGMLLRSRWQASHIASPGRDLTLDHFYEERGLERTSPIPVGRFVEYGQWFQERAVPQLERRRVKRISPAEQGFTVELEDGEEFPASRVVVAGGIVPFAWMPPEFENLPEGLVSHTADHSSLAQFAGRRVVVVGGGQSALESAALLTEHDANVRLLVRGQEIVWLDEDFEEFPVWMYAQERIGIGGAKSAWLAARPELFRFLPRSLSDALAHRTTPPPAGASWLRPRLADVETTMSHSIARVDRRNGHVELGLDNGSGLDADHVLLATGYRVDLRRYRFLDQALLNDVRTLDGSPVLGEGFESSVDGLHFVGLPAARTFGPVMRFVCGTWGAARSVTRGIVGRRAPRTGFSW